MPFIDIFSLTIKFTICFNLGKLLDDNLKEYPQDQLIEISNKKALRTFSKPSDISSIGKLPPQALELEEAVDGGTRRCHDRQEGRRQGRGSTEGNSKEGRRQESGAEGRSQGGGLGAAGAPPGPSVRKKIS